MVVTVFRSRLNPGAQEEYGPLASRMSELARTMPGYISHKGFVAEDGERVTIVEFESDEALRESVAAAAVEQAAENVWSDFGRSTSHVSSRGDGGPIVTPELIDLHRRLAHEMRNAAIRAAVVQIVRGLRRFSCRPEIGFR